MSDPIRIRILCHRGTSAPVRNSFGQYLPAPVDETSLCDNLVSVEMVEAAPMREEFRRVFQDALDDNFGLHETLTIDECVTTMGHEVHHLKDELEKWRARAEKMEKALHECVTITDEYEAWEIAENIVTVAEEALKP